jgi:hypothetical protein
LGYFPRYQLRLFPPVLVALESPAVAAVDVYDLLNRLDRIQLLAVQLTKAQDQIVEQVDLSERLQREIANAKAVLTLYAEDNSPL